MCLDKIVNDPEALTHYSSFDLTPLAGAQGVELLMWLTMRGALMGRVLKIHSNYHVPISNTASAILALENIDTTAEMTNNVVAFSRME